VIATIVQAKKLARAERAAREARARLAAAMEQPGFPSAAAISARRAEIGREAQRRSSPSYGLSGAALLEKYRTLPDGPEWRALCAGHFDAIQAEALSRGIELDLSPLRNLSGHARVLAVLQRQKP
jgi:hypothetical protein